MLSWKVLGTFSLFWEQLLPRKPESRCFSELYEWSSKKSDSKSLEVTFTVLEQNPCGSNPCGSHGNCESTSSKDYNCICHDNYEIKDGECKKEKGSRKLLLLVKQAWAVGLNRVALKLLGSEKKMVTAFFVTQSSAKL